MFRRKRKTSDFHAEIQAHIQQESERLREQGLSEERGQSRCASLIRATSMQAEERSYESGRWLWWDRLGQDFASAYECWHEPGFNRYGWSLLLRFLFGANAAIFPW